MYLPSCTSLPLCFITILRGQCSFKHIFTYSVALRFFLHFLYYWDNFPFAWRNSFGVFFKYRSTTSSLNSWFSVNVFLLPSCSKDFFFFFSKYGILQWQLFFHLRCNFIVLASIIPTEKSSQSGALSVCFQDFLYLWF